MNDELNKLPDALFESLAEEQPDARRLAGIAQQLESSLVPVRPLASRATTILLALGSFVIFAVAAAYPFGYFGFHHLGAFVRLLCCVAIGAAAALLVLALDQELVPGSKRYVRPGLLMASLFAALGGLTAVLFPVFTMEGFISRGFPCLRLGTLCALVFGALLAIWLKRGYAVSGARAGAVAGFLSGLAGVAVLALHCPIQNAGHILVWHFGAIVIASECGVLAGLWYAPRNAPS